MIDVDNTPAEVKALTDRLANVLRDKRRASEPDRQVVDDVERERRAQQCRDWRAQYGFGTWVEPPAGRRMESPERLRKSRIMIIYRSRFRRGRFIDVLWKRTALVWREEKSESGTRRWSEVTWKAAA